MPPPHTHAELEAFARRYAEVLTAGATGTRGDSVRARMAGDETPTALQAIAAERGVTTRAILDLRRKAAAAGFAHHWEKVMPQRERLKLRPVKAEAKRRRVVIFTAAQDETAIHEGFWANLTAYAAHRGAQIMVGGFTYQKGLFEDHSVRAGVYDARIVPMLHPAETAIAPGLIWCGQANILPTAKQPLTSWRTRGGLSSVLLPHAKIALETVPVMPGTPPKIAATTGVCTVANYVRRNAGMVAEWHHTIGCAVVEIDAGGGWWLRTISAEPDGSFQDLDIRVADGKVSAGHRVEAITWGDIHHEILSPAMSAMGWGILPDGTRAAGAFAGKACMIEALRPRWQFLHDLIDFSARNHHNRADPVFLAARHGRNDSIGAELDAVAAWLQRAQRDFCQTVIVQSNHDNALGRWLRSRDGMTDPANSPLWHELNAALHAAACKGQHLDPFEHALRTRLPRSKFRFVRAGDSLTICEPHAPIECGLHGHAGPSGSRGSAAAFAAIAPRVNAGHTHRPCIREGYYSSGMLGNLRPAYVDGPTAWAHADIVTMKSGKRQIVIRNEKGWRG